MRRGRPRKPKSSPKRPLPPLTPGQQELVLEFREAYQTPLKLIKSRARDSFYRARRVGLDEEEIEQAAYLGLVKAAQMFDPSRKVAFSTYALFWMRAKVEECRRHWVRNHANPETRMPPLAMGQVSSAFDVDSPYEGTFPDPSTVEDACDRREVVQFVGEVLARAVDGICRRQREVLVQRYRLENSDDVTLTDLARGLKISKKRVWQIEKAGRENLARILAESGYTTLESVIEATPDWSGTGADDE